MADSTSDPITRLNYFLTRLSAQSVTLPAHWLAELRQIANDFQQQANVQAANVQYYRTLLDQALDAILIIDARLTIQDINARVTDLLGHTRPELMGRPLRHLVPTEDWENFSRQILENQTGLREWRMLRKNGSALNVELSLKRLGQGRLQLSVRDVTERKQLEASRRENELRLQAIVSSIDDIVFEYDADGTYVDIWTRNSSLLIRPVEALLGRTLEEVLEPTIAAQLLEKIRRVLHTGQPETVEYPLDFGDQRRWFLARLAPIPASSSFVKTVIMLARDITERKNAEEQLEQNAAEIASLYRASSQLLAPIEDVAQQAQHIAESVTREFNFVACSVLLFDEATQTLERIATVGDFHLDAPSVLPISGNGLTVHAFNSGITVYVPDVTQDSRYRQGDTHTRTELAVPLLAGSRRIGVLDLQSPEIDAFSERARNIVDVFAEQAALALENSQLIENLEHAREAAEEASRLKSMFLANTSHELRTPLAIIMGSLDAIVQGFVLNHEQPQLLGTAHAASQRLLYLINDLLDFAKIEAGRLDLELKATDVLPIIAEVYMFLRGRAEEKKLRLEIRLPDEPPPLIWADSSKVEQILLNVIGNAIKFTEAGGVTVSLEIEREPLACAVITVTDTGIGIALDKQPQLFQPFVQADGSSTRRYGGTGLGLSISRRLAELMGGTLTLYSDGLGHGSRFTLRLPLAEQVALEEMPAPAD
jgi:PAS domain S-box-containing protein